MDEFQRRITAEGARYCPLALELILGSPCDGAHTAGPIEEAPAEEPQIFDPVFDGEFIFPDVPSEPIGGEY